VSAWTDPDVVVELATSCRFAPPKATTVGEISPLSCEAGMFDQSCVYDPCFNDNQDKCKPKCKSACDACATHCTSACETCKKPCKDDDCKMACATTCGACRQECLKEKDHCISGTCAAQYERCHTDWRARYFKSACPAACPKFRTCFDACTSTGDYDAACVDKCRAKARPACPGDLLILCENGPY
jgi:hypothetical protein